MNHYYIEEINSIKNKIIMVLLYIIVGCLLFVYFTRNVSSKNYSDEQIADAIYKAEGGERAKIPYGILSIKTNDTRKICLNTIRNQRIRHRKHNCGKEFLQCLAHRYCPTNKEHLTFNEKRLNIYWYNNVKYFLGKNKKGE